MHSIRKRVRKKSAETTSAEILNCVFDGHFNIPSGHGRGFMNGREVKQLTLVGHMTVSRWRIQYVRIHYIQNVLFFNVYEVNSNVLPTQYLISDAETLFESVHHFKDFKFIDHIALIYLYFISFTFFLLNYSLCLLVKQTENFDDSSCTTQISVQSDAFRPRMSLPLIPLATYQSDSSIHICLLPKT